MEILEGEYKPNYVIATVSTFSFQKGGLPNKRDVCRLCRIFEDYAMDLITGDAYPVVSRKRNGVLNFEPYECNIYNHPMVTKKIRLHASKHPAAFMVAHSKFMSLGR